MAIPPPPPPSTPPPPPPSSPAPAKGGNRTVIVILCVLAGIILLIGGCVTTCAYFAAKKTKEYSASLQKNPVYASLSLAASLHPDIQVVSKDEDSGKITLRNKKTNETVTIDTKEYSVDNIGRAFEKFAQANQPASTSAAAVEAPAQNEPAPAARDEKPAEESEPQVSVARATAMTGTLQKFPAVASLYPGAQLIDAQYNVIMNMIGATYEAQTTDSPEKIADYYEKKMTAAGYTIAGRTSGSNNNGPTCLIVGALENPTRNVTVSAETQSSGKVKIGVAYTGQQK